MIEITIREISKSIDSLRYLSSLSLRAKTALQVARAMREIQKQLDNFEKARTQLIKKYGKKDENQQLIVNNGKYIIDPIKINDFNNE